MSVITQPFAGAFEADRIHSSFGFGVRHMGVSIFRGGFGDVSARLTGAADGPIALEAETAAESISITAPPEFRAHVLGEEFLDAQRHPSLAFRSHDVALADDGTAHVRGELTIRGVTRPITATGTWASPVDDPFGGRRGALELQAVIDRREYGLTWNAPLPKGGDALGNEVTMTVHLELVEAA